MIIKGHKGNEYEILEGWLAADREGRSGTVVSMAREEDPASGKYPHGEYEIVVDPGFGVMYTFRESQITYTAPPEGDVG